MQSKQRGLTPGGCVVAEKQSASGPLQRRGVALAVEMQLLARMVVLLLFMWRSGVSVVTSPAKRLGILPEICILVTPPRPK